MDSETLSNLVETGRGHVAQVGRHCRDVEDEVSWSDGEL